MVSRADRRASPPTRDAVYSDFLTNFNAHPNTGDVIRRVDSESVKRALRNLLFTNKGERFFQPDFGSDIKKYLFEPVSEMTQRNLRTAIKEAVEHFEKRAILEDVVVKLNNDEESYTIDLYFRIINNPETQSLNVKLDRIR